MKVYNFETLQNVRDLGGTKTKDGSIIKQDKLFRGTALFYASNNDTKTLSNKIDTVIDLRTFNEVEEMPHPKDKFPNSKYIHNPIVKKMKMILAKDKESQSMTLEQAHVLTEKEAKKLMSDFYILIASNKDSQEAYRNFINILADNNTNATYWHCSYGKDRAGMAAALILYILGVDKDTIYDDYIYSTGFLIPHIEQSMDKIISKFDNKINVDAFMFMQTSDIEYIDSLINYVKTEYGSIDNYITNELKISEDVKDKLRDKYLTKN